jgi:hypothetical protein
LALLSNQAVFAQAAHGMYPPIHPGLYNQFYGTPETYPTDLALAAMANRLQTQFTSPYAALPAQGLGVDHNVNQVPSSPQNGGGPSANNRKLGLYKTELCRSWEEKGSCRYGGKCQFAHGEDELRNVARHPKVSFQSSFGVLSNDIVCISVQDRNLQGKSTFWFEKQILIMSIDVLGVWSMPVWKALLLYPYRAACFRYCTRCGRYSSAVGYGKQPRALE